MKIFNYKTKKIEDVKTMFSPMGMKYGEDDKQITLEEDSNLVLIGEDLNTYNAYSLDDLKKAIAECEMEFKTTKEEYEKTIVAK